VVCLPPSNFDEWLSSNFWWTLGFNSIAPAFSRLRAMELFNASLHMIKHAWTRSWVLSGQEAQVQFELFTSKHQNWEAVCKYLWGLSGSFLIQQNTLFVEGNWIGLYEDMSDILPLAIFEGHTQPACNLQRMQQSLFFPIHSLVYKVLHLARVLIPHTLSRLTKPDTSLMVTGYPS
jgi:hypothetical protein